MMKMMSNRDWFIKLFSTHRVWIICVFQRITRGQPYHSPPLFYTTVKGHVCRNFVIRINILIHSHATHPPSKYLQFQIPTKLAKTWNCTAAVRSGKHWKSFGKLFEWFSQWGIVAASKCLCKLNFAYFMRRGSYIVFWHILWLDVCMWDTMFKIVSWPWLHTKCSKAVEKKSIGSTAMVLSAKLHVDGLVWYSVFI